MPIGPDGTYLAPQFTPSGFPVPYFPNDVQHATRWNVVIDAINALRPNIILPFDEGGLLSTGVKGSNIDVGFGGSVVRAAMNIAVGQDLEATGSLDLNVRVNDVVVYTITLTDARKVVELDDAGLFGFVAGDNLQAEVVSVTDCTAYALTLVVRREGL